MIHVRVLTREFVENEALVILRRYETEFDGSVRPPIDVDLIGEEVFELTWDWDVMEDPLPRQTTDNNRHLVILAGLYPRKRLVVLNEAHADVFRAKPGLERFTKGHEIGHWVLHIDKAALDHPSLFEDDDERDPAETIICRDGDDTWIERQADWFSAGLLMPKEPFLEAARQVDLTRWRARYELAEQFGVTISALGNRLNRFGLSYVDEYGTIHTSAAVSRGQLAIH